MAWYDIGTVSVTNGSTTVTGSGTDFIAGAQIGEAFYGPDERLYEIQAIVSATVLTLGSPYLGSTQTAQAYYIIPTQSLVASLANEVSSLITDFQSVADLAGAGKFANGTAALPGITFNLDQDTGFSRPAANQIGFSTAGVQRALLSSTALTLNVPLTAAAISATSITGSAVTQSALDLTSGRLTKVGDGGLLTNNGETNTGDLNDLRYGAITAPVNQPNAPRSEQILWSGGRSGGARAAQFVVDHGRPVRAFARGYNSGRSAGDEWSNWAELYHNENILGTVSQSGGAPTGGIIQRGSNSNGEFVRFADGTQICTTPEEAINIDESTGSVFRGLAPIFPWPAAFASLLWSSSVPAPSSTVTVWGGNAVNTNLTQTRLRLFSSQSLEGQSGYIIGFGRWF